MFFIGDVVNVLFYKGEPKGRNAGKVVRTGTDFITVEHQQKNDIFAGTVPSNTPETYYRTYKTNQPLIHRVS